MWSAKQSPKSWNISFFLTHNFKKISVNGPMFYVLIPQSQRVTTMEGNLDLQCRVRVAG